MGKTIDQAGERRSAAVESLRALAALAVLEGHVFGTSHGYGGVIYAGYLNRTLFGGGFGVYLFFALTGYLLYRPFARRDFGAGDRVRFGRYAANRAFRILPLYYVVLVAYVIAFDHGGSATTWWRSVLFLENFYPPTLGHIDGVMWSLVVELQFYVLLPLLALAVARAVAGSARLATWMLLGIGVLAELVRLATVTTAHPADPRWQYSLPATFVFFVPGMLLAVLETQWESVAPRLRRGLLAPWRWFAVGVALWLVVTWRYDLDVLLAPAAFVMVGSVVLPMRRDAVHRVLEWRPLAAVGVASYSLYLWHFPIVDHVGTSSWAPHGYVGLLAVCAPFAVLVALVSYRLVEAPFLRLRRAWASTSPAQAPETSPRPAPHPA